MREFFQTILTASFHGSIVILVVLLLRLILKKAPKKYICTLWILVGIRLLLPIPVESAFSLQPVSLTIPIPAAFGKIGMVAWAAVAAGIGIYSLASYIHLRRQVLDAVKIPGGWESDRIDTAFVLGFLRPRIYIPTGMSQQTRKQILAHEQTHLDKGDQWIKMLGFVALVLHWFNPLVWVSYICLCKDIEMACDERVIQFMELEERKAYSSALLRCSTNQVHYAACPVAFGEVSVKYRIKSILNYRKPSFWLSLLAVAAFLFVGVCLVTNPQTTVEVPVDADAPLRQLSGQMPEDFTPAVLPECPENPDWGVALFADVRSTTEGTLVFRVEERFAATSETLRVEDLTLEKWNGEAWEPMTTRDGNVMLMADETWGFSASRSSSVNYYPHQVDWSLRYGALPAGDYRFRTRLVSATDSAVFYAPFHIYRRNLPSEQEAAIARCSGALSALAEGNAYQVRLSATAPDGEVYPTRMITRSDSLMRVDNFVGDMQISSYNGEGVADACQGWEEPFRPEANRQFLFPEGASTITDGEITFHSVWSDYSGVSCRGKDTYLFNEDGTLQSVRRVTETLDSGGNVADSQVLLLEALEENFQGYITDIAEYDYKDSFDTQKESPWGIFFRVDDDLLTATGGEVWLRQNTVGVSNFTTDGTYWLEKKVGSSWERLGGKDKTASWGEETIHLMNKTAFRQVDWSDSYGTLDSGVYRMGKRFFRDQESTIQYGEFAIYPSGGVYGPGGEEALARVDTALEAVAKGSYRVEKTMFSTSGYDRHVRMTEVYWKYGDTVVVDFYNDVEKYSHSAAQGPDGVYYDAWMKRSYFDNGYDSILFPAGYSRIRDEEIQLVYSYGNSTPNRAAILYTYRFDEKGKLRQVEEYFLENGLTCRYTITDTPEAEIQSWVEAKKKEQTPKTSS